MNLAGMRPPPLLAKAGKSDQTKTVVSSLDKLNSKFEAYNEKKAQEAPPLTQPKPKLVMEPLRKEVKLGLTERHRARLTPRPEPLERLMYQLKSEPMALFQLTPANKNPKLIRSLTSAFDKACFPPPTQPQKIVERDLISRPRPLKKPSEIILEGQLPLPEPLSTQILQISSENPPKIDLKPAKIDLNQKIDLKKSAKIDLNQKIDLKSAQTPTPTPTP